HRPRLAGLALAWVQALAGRYADQESTTRRVLAAAEAAGDSEDVLLALGSLWPGAHVWGRFPGGGGGAWGGAARSPARSTIQPGSASGWPSWLACCCWRADSRRPVAWRIR